MFSPKSMSNLGRLTVIIIKKIYFVWVTMSRGQGLGNLCVILCSWAVRVKYGRIAKHRNTSSLLVCAAAMEWCAAYCSWLAEPSPIIIIVQAASSTIQLSHPPTLSRWPPALCFLASQATKNKSDYPSSSLVMVLSCFGLRICRNQLATGGDVNCGV